MKKIEVVLVSIAILAIIIKIFFGLTFSFFILFFSFLLLISFYNIFSFALINDIKFSSIFDKNSYKDINEKRIIGAIAFGLTLSIILVGVFFKLQIWSRANIILIVGIIQLLFILIFSVIRYFKNKASYYNKIIRRIIIIGGIGIILFSTPTNTLIDIYYRNYPEYAEIFKQSIEEPDNIELQEQMEKKRQELFGIYEE